MLCLFQYSEELVIRAIDKQVLPRKATFWLLAPFYLLLPAYVFLLLSPLKNSSCDQVLQKYLKVYLCKTL